MARTGSREKNKKVKRLVALKKEKRDAIRAKIKSARQEDSDLTPADVVELSHQLYNMPTNSCPTRKNNRCRIDGRPHAVSQTFGINRIKFRELALNGKIPGVKKASW